MTTPSLNTNFETDLQEPDTKYVLSYVRTSTDTQHTSIINQTNQIKYYAEKNGYTIKASYVDEGISGSSIEKRPALKRLLKNAEKGDTIVVTNLDRLSRSIDDTNTIITKLKDIGSKLIVISQESENKSLINLMYNMFDMIFKDCNLNNSREIKKEKENHFYRLEKFDDGNVIITKQMISP